MNRKYLTIKEAATFLGVSPLTLRNWDKSGRFSAGRHPISNYRVYKMEHLEAFAEALAKEIDGGDGNSRRAKLLKPKIKKLKVVLED